MNQVTRACLIFCTMSCTFMGLSSVIAAGDWQLHMISLPLLITAGMLGVGLWAGRHKIVGGVASVITGLVIWVCYLTGVTGGGILPTPKALTILVTHISDAITALPDYGRPASNADLFVPLGILGLGPMCVLAVFLALNLRNSLAAGIPILGCWVVFLSGAPGDGLGWVIASTAMYLLLLAISNRKGRKGRLQPIAIPVVALSAAVGVIGSYLLPLAPGWGRSEDILRFWDSTYTDNTGINVDGPIRVSDSLRSQSDILLFHTRGEIDGPLKMGTLDQFTGDSWVASTRTRARPYREGTLVGADANPPDSAWSPGPDVSVRIDQLSGQIVPSADGPRSISEVNGLALTYDAGTDAFRSRANPVGEGDSYVTHTMVLDRSALTGIRASTRDSLLGGSVGHPVEISELTTSVIGDAVSQDDMLKAIEAYLRGLDFTYTLTPTWDSQGDPVWDFLQAKKGYCVHFASAMAVMAMSVGIPMRVSVGYLSGMVESDDWRGVTGGRAHMWPEAYFAGVGWVRYEPTPAVQSDDVGQTGPIGESSSTAAQGEESAAAQTQTATAEATVAPTTEVAAPGEGTTDWALIGEIGGGLVGGAAIIVLAWLAYVRAYSPERAWRAIMRAGQRKGVVADSMSVRKAADILSRRDPSGAGLLGQIRDSLEISRYGPPDMAGERIPGSLLWKSTRTIIRHLRD